MKKTELAYVAGFFDGEGSISIAKTGRRGSNRVELTVAMSNTNEWVVQWFKFSFGGCLSYQNLSLTHPNWQDVWRWQVRCRQAVKFLKIILPYLILKRPQAELAIRFQSRQKQGVKTALTEKRVLDEAEHILMKSLNRGRCKDD